MRHGGGILWDNTGKRYEMPHFELQTLLTWIHVAAMAIGGGSAAVIIILLGFEETREDLHGLTSLLWKRSAAWGFRIAFLLGIVLMGMLAKAGVSPMDMPWILWKLPLVVGLLAFSEMSPKALAAHKRGAPLLAFLLFLLVTFVSVNQGAFSRPIVAKKGMGGYSGSVEPGK